MTTTVLQMRFEDMSNILSSEPKSFFLWSPGFSTQPLLSLVFALLIERWTRKTELSLGSTWNFPLHSSVSHCWKTKQFCALRVCYHLHYLQVLFKNLDFFLLHFLIKGCTQTIINATQGDSHFGNSPHISTQFRALSAASKESINFSQHNCLDWGASQKWDQLLCGSSPVPFMKGD